MRCVLPGVFVNLLPGEFEDLGTVCATMLDRVNRMAFGQFQRAVVIQQFRAR